MRRLSPAVLALTCPGVGAARAMRGIPTGAGSPAAFAKIIDEVNELSLAEVRGGLFPRAR